MAPFRLVDVLPSFRILYVTSLLRSPAPAMADLHRKVTNPNRSALKPYKKCLELLCWHKATSWPSASCFHQTHESASDGIRILVHHVMLPSCLDCDRFGQSGQHIVNVPRRDLGSACDQRDRPLEWHGVDVAVLAPLRSSDTGAKPWSPRQSTQTPINRIKTVRPRTAVGFSEPT